MALPNPVKKYAIIINGDAETRHLGNVDRAIKALRAEGEYSIAVASPKKPKHRVEKYRGAKLDDLKKVIAGLKRKLDSNDQLVIYVTGHGDNKGKGGACVELSGGCYSLKSLATLLSPLKYGKRLVVMDNCYSGMGLSWYANKKTNVITQGSPGEKVSCQTFSPYFWSTKVPDLNQDKTISIQERYTYALQKGKTASLTQIYNPIAMSLSGKNPSRPFGNQSTRPKVVTRHKKLQKELKKLKPGQFALVMFSADWCGPCKSYLPKFRKITKSYRGQFLPLVAKGIKGSEQDWSKYGVSEFPTVAFIDHRGKVTVVDQKDPKGSLVTTAFKNSKEILKYYEKRLASKDAQVRVNAVAAIGRLGKNGFKVLTKIIRALDDPSIQVRLEATILLEGFGPSAQAAIPRLRALLYDKNNQIVSAAAFALAAIYPRNGGSYKGSQISSSDATIAHNFNPFHIPFIRPTFGKKGKK